MNWKLSVRFHTGRGVSSLIQWKYLPQDPFETIVPRCILYILNQTVSGHSSLAGRFFYFLNYLRYFCTFLLFSPLWVWKRKLRVPWPAIYEIFDVIVKTNYTRLLSRSNGIWSCVRISGDVIHDDVIAILRFWRFDEKMASLGGSLAKKGWTQTE